ncbi:uncharacterized protein K02A2.6-like [Carassius auratus]|uniref:Gypsy retrotransposon integrase-like protein 1 n=1 Tax=Carassius auratus TaxID=7957 RepID=A0A6P6J380_CARAU|nr:uncharacterized protein K02A2.6-like [Carassius auratus]
MDWDSVNLPDAWRRFRQHVQLMFAGPLRDKEEETMCSYLLLWVGEKGRDVYNTWTLSADESKKLQSYYDKFEEYVMPKANPIFARYKFHEKIQGEHETFEHFVTELKLLVKDCGYTNSDEMVRDRIVFATNSPKVREKLLNQSADLTLEKAIDIARSHEVAQDQLRMINSRATAAHDRAAHAVISKKSTSDRQKHGATAKEADRVTDRNRPCGRCALLHNQRGACPAKGRRCKICNKLNHFAKVCKSKQPVTHKAIHTVGNTDILEGDELFIDAINKEHESTECEQAFAELELGQKASKVSFKLDTGAQVNIIPAGRFEKLFSTTELKPTTRRLTGYGGEPLDVKGTCQLNCRYKDTEAVLEFYIVSTHAPPVLGLRACLDLGLIKLVFSVDADTSKTCDIMQEFQDVFHGIGEFPGECTIHIDPTAVPVVYPPRRIPFTLRSRLKEELDSMEKSGIIVKVTEPTDWVNALVVVEKPRTGKLRVCLDPRDLNKAIKRPHYPLPTLDDITPKLAGAQFFSVLDAKSGYWAIKLSESSSKLTTFNTVVGRYRFLRLPFGLVSAQDEFQRKIDETYEGLDGVAAIVDDILVFGKTKEEHDANLRAVLVRTREKGVRLNPDKSVICVPEVSYFGHKLTREGIKPDPEKISAIRDMSPPKNKSELETILGMVNYLSRFAPNLSEINAPMRQLLKQSSEFVWDATQMTAFEKMKELITREPGPVLSYYDPGKELHLQVDASKSGLGAVLLQDQKPIAYASKSLTPTEENYAQIEKELYAVVFGCKRFHAYVYGRKVIVESDHKPLEPILRKPLAAAPPRLQRMILQLQRYDIEIVHRPGKDIPIADTLSRKSISYRLKSLDEDMDAQIHTVVDNLPVSDSKLTSIRKATEQDPQFSSLRSVIKSGWPDVRKKCPYNLTEYWNHRNEISEIDGLLFKGEKIIIPHALRAEMLERIHTGHMGIERSKQRARDILFWPGMNKQIEEMVERCTTCLERRKSNAKEPMISHQIPERPWQVVATDLFMWNGDDYIIATDYYSRFFELERLHSTTSSAVIRKLKAIFARHGIPEKIISDNGPQFSSHDFKNFAIHWDFMHVTSSPHYPQSNGLAEKTVQTAKAMLSKAQADKKDPYLSLLEHRSTPVDGFKSPSQLLMSRRLRSILPMSEKQLQPQVVDQKLVNAKRKLKQATQRQYYDRTAQPLSALAQGDNVRFQQTNGRWMPATVLQPVDAHRSYLIRTHDDQVFRRNRRHLMETKEMASETNEPAPESMHIPAPVDTGGLKENNGSMHQKAVTPQFTRSGRMVKPRDILDL